jgi:hypothetical protein
VAEVWQVYAMDGIRLPLLIRFVTMEAGQRFTAGVVVHVAFVVSETDIAAVAFETGLGTGHSSSIRLVQQCFLGLFLGWRLSMSRRKRRQ